MCRMEYCLLYQTRRNNPLVYKGLRSHDFSYPQSSIKSNFPLIQQTPGVKWTLGITILKTSYGVKYRNNLVHS